MTQTQYDEALESLCKNLNTIKDNNSEIKISLENADILKNAEILAKESKMQTYAFLQKLGYFLIKDTVKTTTEIINYLSENADEDGIVTIRHGDKYYFPLEGKAMREGISRDAWVKLHSNNQLCLYVVGKNENEYISRRLAHYADKNGIVYDLNSKDSTLAAKIKEQASKFGHGITEYVQECTPYRIYSANFFMYPENINYYLSTIATADGYVDAILGTKEMRAIAKCLKRQSVDQANESERLLLQDYIAQNTDFKLRKIIVPVDYKAHLQESLLKMYPNKFVRKLRRRNQTLYEQVRNYRNYNNMPTIMSALEDLGFFYLSARNIDRRRYSNKVIKALLIKKYPDGKIPSSFHAAISKHIIVSYCGKQKASDYIRDELELDPQFESKEEQRLKRIIITNPITEDTQKNEY